MIASMASEGGWSEVVLSALVAGSTLILSEALCWLQLLILLQSG